MGTPLVKYMCCYDKLQRIRRSTIQSSSVDNIIKPKLRYLLLLLLYAMDSVRFVSPSPNLTHRAESMHLNVYSLQCSVMTIGR